MKFFELDCFLVRSEADARRESVISDCYIAVIIGLLITNVSYLFQIVVREVGRLRPISDYVFPAAESLLAKSDATPEKNQFESRVLATRTLWQGVRHRSDNRHVVIERVFPLAQNYDDAYRVLQVWLRETEQRVINLTPVPCNSESVGNQYRNLAVSHEFGWLRSRTFDSSNAITERLLTFLRRNQVKIGTFKPLVVKGLAKLENIVAERLFLVMFPKHLFPAWLNWGTFASATMFPV